MTSIDVDRDLDEPLEALLDDAATALLAALAERFAAPADDLLAARGARQQAVDEGRMPAFPADGDDADWRVVEVPADLGDRRVELHVAPSATELVAAFGAGVSPISLSLASALPGRDGCLAVQKTLTELLCAARGDPGHNGARPAFVFGPRPLGRRETALRWQGAPVHAALADLALYLRHNALALASSGSGAYLALSGLDSAAEARLWADMLGFAAQFLELDAATLQVTLSIDTVHAAFAADSMLHELRRHASALTFDRHACLRGFVHTFRRHPQFILPDPAELTTATHFLRCRGLHLIRVAHARGASAIAPCVPWLPLSADAPGSADGRVKADLERHARDGFDGSGIAHPGLLPEARDVYNRLVPAAHQQHRSRCDVRVTGADLLQVVKGKITERGMRRNLSVGLHGYVAARDGRALLDLDGRRETAASIALAADQLWQWVRHETGVLDDGRIVDAALFDDVLADVCEDSELPPDDLREAVDCLRHHVLDRDSPGDFPADATLP